MSVTFAARPLWMPPYPVADYAPLPAVVEGAVRRRRHLSGRTCC